MKAIKKFLAATAILFAFAAPAAFASSMTGSYNSFSATGLTQDPGGLMVYVFDNLGNSLGDTSFHNGDVPAFNNRSIQSLGGTDPVIDGTYTLVVGNVNNGQVASANSFCGAGKTLTNCATFFGSVPMTNPYSVSIVFAIAQISPKMFNVATGTASTFTAAVTSQLANTGTLEVIAVAVGIPLAFYVIHQLIGLLPKSRARR